MVSSTETVGQNHQARRICSVARRARSPYAVARKAAGSFGGRLCLVAH